MVASNPRDEAERRFLLMLADIKIIDPFQLNQVLLRQAMDAGYVCYYTPERTRVLLTPEGLARLDELYGR